MLMKRLVFLTLMLPLGLFAQSTVKTVNMEIPKGWTVIPKNFKEDYSVSLKRAEAPMPSGEHAKKYMHELKQQLEKDYPKQYGKTLERGGRDTSDTLTVVSSFPSSFWFNQNPLSGGTPNDNAMAIANNGNLIASWNSQVWGYDVVADTYLFSSISKHPSFSQFLNIYSDSSFTLYFPFDPKLLYHPTYDRFILVFLSADAAGQGRDPETSETVIFFSSTNDPKDEWSAYRIPGDPLTYTSWADYPQLAMNEHSVYLTLNQLYPDSGWVEGFAETVLWQMDLEDGFNGAANLGTKFWTGFEYEGSKLRYLRPVKTAWGPESDTMFFVANRPFVTTNDSFFLVRTVGDVNSASSQVDVKLAMTDVPYWHPPYAKQAAGQEFWTNDARCLGAVRMGKEIQFTGNTLNPENGFAAIYHGIIDDYDNPSVTGNIISVSEREFGFPNIDFIGNKEGDKDVALFFNHTGISTNAGNSAVFFNSDREYGPVQWIKEGDAYVNAMNSAQERWGDYTAIQRRFNDPGKFWVSGYWGYGTNRPGSWIAELAHPDYQPVGIDGEVKTQRTHVFPNPAMEFVSFEFEVAQQAVVNFEIRDLNGRKVADLGKDQLSIGSHVLSFDLSPLSAGVYIVQAKSQNDVIFQEKVVKQ